ncbi:ABC transporter substrate-binding protein [Paenibacillus sp. KACC 21273]|uniref:ABC transporter substrate-binding protein n=1 Tax=Paenibacillus sp. KACC 21273 TaxID=3025665 RepID=UPI002367159C|nr:ABC transporter substrate-binding protein [Paenibacillus sp. KACC 21273]WDF51664.1 ABC transporter substrate-binding protein [Paenibacillus sp. KACC 21273]
MPRKLFRYALAPMLVVALASVTACGSSDPVETETSDVSTPITISFFGSDANPTWNNMQDDVGKAITKATNVTLNAEYDVSGGGTQKIALMTASGDYPDMITPKGSISKLVEAGALIDLTDLINKYGPNIKKVYGDDLARLQYSKEDPSIYVLPTNAGVGQTSFDAGGGFEVQNAVMKELGYPKIETVKDFEKVLKEYKEKNPTINGQPTIPLSLNADDWKIQITVTNPAFLSTGAPDDGEFYIDPETYEAQLHYKRPEEKEYFRWLNHMYNEGLLDPETFTQKTDQYNSKIASGRVLGLIDQDWDYQQAENALKSSGMTERAYGHYPVQLTTETKDRSFQDIGAPVGYGIGITTSAKDPIRIIKFLDWMSSDEAQVLNQWGIEGKQYNMKDGKRVIPADVQDMKTNDNTNFVKTTGVSGYTIFGVHYGDGVKDPSGNYYTTNFPEQIIAGYTASEKETLKAYGATTWKDLFPQKDEFPVKPWGAAYNLPAPDDQEYTVNFQKGQDIVRKRIPEAILASPEEFDGIYDEMVAELSTEPMKKMEASYTQMIKDTVELWSKPVTAK